MLKIEGEFVSLPVREAVYRERAGECLDSLELLLGTEKGMVLQKEYRLEYEEGDFRSGLLYIDEWELGKEGLRLFAVPCKPLEKRSFLFRNADFENLVEEICKGLGMDYVWLGEKPITRYDYICEEGITGLGLLHKLAILENKRLKMESGKLYIVDMDYVGRVFSMRLGLADGDYVRQRQLGSLGIQSRGETGLAFDLANRSGAQFICPLWNAPNLATAKRWAKGQLLYENMKNEYIGLQTSQNLMALDRVQVQGELAPAGEYMVLEADKDLQKGNSKLKLGRLREVGWKDAQ